MAELTLQAQPRNVTRKKVSTLRKEGIIPLVIYGGQIEGAISAQIDERTLLDTLQRAGTSRLITLEVSGRQYPTLAREIQRDPVTHRVIHVDFQSVRLDRPIQAEVALRLVGQSPIVEAEEAILTHAIDTVLVEALPRALVSHLDVDLAALEEVGDTITVGDIPVPDGITLLTDPDIVVASAQPLPSLELVEEPAAVEGEPEVVGVEGEEAEEVEEMEEAEAAEDEE